MAVCNSIDDAFNKYIHTHSTYNNIVFRHIGTGVNSKLHPVFVMSQYILDSLAEEGKSRYTIILPDDHCQIITLAIARYFQFLQDDPSYATSIFEDIAVGQHVKLGKAVAEFLDMPLGGDIRVNDAVAKADNRVYENFTVSWDVRITAEPEEEIEKVVEEPEEVVEAPRSVVQPEPIVEAQPVVQEQVAEAPQPEAVPEAETKSAENTEPEAEPPAEPIDMVVFANKQTIVMKGKPSYVYVDVFEYINFDVSAAASKGRGIVTLLNGRPAQFMEPLNEGDHIDVYWK